jgi:GTP-binding protein LepA
MDLERERITIKSHAIQMEYTYKGEEYILNLIDTWPRGFSYEVSIYCRLRRGTLIVDAAQSIQAQTIKSILSFRK